MFIKQTVFLVLLGTACSGAFVIPEVQLEAYTPKGFRASIPDQDGMQLFAFHGKVNEDISRIEPGQYSGDFKSPSKGRWTYFNEDLVLKPGDKISYWIFIQHDKSGYRKDNQKWTVSDLVELKSEDCIPSTTVASEQTLVCKDSVIFEDDFIGDKIDEKKWLVEEYIATNAAEDYEFVSYQKRQCGLANGKLVIKPIFARAKSNVEGELDLRNRCTREPVEECYAKSDNVFILPPVTSGRMISRKSFRYGKIEIKAKLPAGDWVYPQMYLEQTNDKNKKIWVGYARGNAYLVGANENDIGSTVLYGGPIVDVGADERTLYLKSFKSKTGSITAKEHTFTLIWKPNGIKLLLDGGEYGAISEDVMKKLKFSESDTVRIVLGVGVGGVNDFPDFFQSGNDPKPWRNRGRSQLLNFFDARDKWTKTWGDQSNLKVESVKVTAL